MRYLFVSLWILFSTGLVQASVPTVAEQMRSVELQRQADESGRWLQAANVIYFKTLEADQVVDPEELARLEKIADPYRGRFLNPRQADRLCGLIKEHFKQEGASLNGFFCSVKNGILKVRIKP